MKSLSISEVKATLSAQLRRVKAGEEVIIEERGRPIARIVPIHEGDGEPDLMDLERAGLLKRGRGSLPSSFWSLPRADDPDAAVRAAVDADRNEGW